MRGSISTQRLPASSVSSAGTFSMKTARRLLRGLVERDRREDDRQPARRGTPRAAARSPPRRSSRSQTSGDAGSVKPTLTSTTIRAGRRPKPARPWKPSWRDPARGSRLPAPGCRRPRARARAPRRPARAATSAAASPGCGGSRPVSSSQRASTLLERRAEVERERLAALLALARPLGLGRLASAVPSSPMTTP